MTSKFSQGSAVQTLPPVCHSWPPHIEPWVPPPYPDVHGYCNFQVLLWDFSRQEVQLRVILPWVAIHSRWEGAEQADDCRWSCQITPQAAPLPVQIHVETYNILGYVDNYSWHAPPYTPQEPWASQEHYETIPYYATWSWHTFATYH